jgi:glyoxylate reductase
MPVKPKVFVTRILPEAGLSLIRAACDAEIWPDPLPPSADVLLARIADIDGLVSLLTDRLDAAVLDRARGSRSSATSRSGSTTSTSPLAPREASPSATRRAS